MTADERKQLDEADTIFRKGETSMRALTAELHRLEHRGDAGARAASPAPN